MIKVPSQKILAAVQQPQEGELAYVEKEERYFKYVNGAWTPAQKEDMISLGSLYDMNKQIVAQLLPLDDEKLEEGKKTIEEFRNSHMGSKYFMLLNNEMHYYTVFATRSRRASNPYIGEIMECIQELGVVKSIALTDGEDAVEIWIEVNEDPRVFYLFDYENGVIECQ